VYRAGTPVRFRPASLFVLVCLAVCAGASRAELQDPTQPPAYQSARPVSGDPKTPDLVVSSILVSPGRRVAVVNGHTVTRGDVVGDARVIEIRRDSVRLERAGRSFSLALVPVTVKQPSTHKAPGKR
jgi:MSHA biogenesis protein MshK